MALGGANPLLAAGDSGSDEESDDDFCQAAKQVGIEEDKCPESGQDSWLSLEMRDGSL